MRQRKYRAWHTADIELGTPLKFITAIKDDELVFVMEEDHEFWYPFFVPFQDT